MKTEQQRG